MVPTYNSVILEQASIELVPERVRGHDSCKLVERRFGIKPDMQILDDNYHHELVLKLPDAKKRGRPDIVHFALLDITGTPAYIEGLLDVYVHTINEVTIKLRKGVRLPRTLQRFNGVITKLLSGKLEENEAKLFEVERQQSIVDLVSKVKSDMVVSLTTEGRLADLVSFTRDIYSKREKVTWIIGGFSYGHFNESVKALSSDIISISKHSLPAHVATARLCYAIELSKNS